MAGMIKFPTDDATVTGYLAAPKTARGSIVVLHAWWGLNPLFKAFCDRLASEGFVALAPDLYHGKVASTIDEAKRLESKMKHEVAEKEILGALDYLSSNTAAKGQGLGIVGFSLGGFLALGIVDKRPSDLAAIVVFYATHKGNFTKTQAAFQGHFAEDDPYAAVEEVRELEEIIRRAKREIAFYTYPGTKHWFFEGDRPEFDAKAARLAWERTVQFLHAKLQ